MNWYHHQFNTFICVDSSSTIHCFIKDEYGLNRGVSKKKENHKVEYQNMSFYYVFLNETFSEWKIKVFPIEEGMVPFVFVDFIESNQWLLYVSE